VRSQYAGADLDDGVDGEAEEFSAAHAGSGQDLDHDEPVERVGQLLRAAVMKAAAWASSRNFGRGLSRRGRSLRYTGSSGLGTSS
jgi:hypothetical protein